MNWEQWDNAKIAGCALCEQAGGELIWQNEQLRVVLVDDKLFAGFTRVIWQEHVVEMTDLSLEQREVLMRTVYLVETIQREVLKPTKINLASLGNMTPHLHWHVIPRWPLDSRFPDAVWAAPRARTPEQELAWAVFQENQQAQLPVYRRALREALERLPA